MITPGTTLENPITGERFTFTATAATTGGELLAFDFHACARAGKLVPIPHVHPTQTERFEVPTGGSPSPLPAGRAHPGSPSAGDVIEVPPGVLHAVRQCRGLVKPGWGSRSRPALAMEEMFASVIALARSGRMNRHGLPRNHLRARGAGAAV